MKWIQITSTLAVALLLSTATPADAGLYESLMNRGGSECGDQKSCGCTSDCQPECCKPVIVRPCEPTIHTYQRACSTIKPPCCDTCTAPATCCAPCADTCAPAYEAPCADTCAPAYDSCAPACDAPKKSSCLLGGLGGGKADTCSDNCAPTCEAPYADACAPACDAPCADTCAPTCAAPEKSSCLLGGIGGGKADTCSDNCAPTCEAPYADACAPACDAPCDTSYDDSCNNGCSSTGYSRPKGLLSGLFGGSKSNCGDSCSDDCTQTACEGECCDADPCEIAKLIYQSQTACYAKDRRDAIHELGDDYSCKCNPEIMCAFVYALNDADERVRKEAADEIGDQIREHGCCCCTPEVVQALTAALGDCDRGVRNQAEEALEECGYEIVDGCCDDGCTDSCNNCAPAHGYAAPVEGAPTHAAPVAPGTGAPTPADLPAKEDMGDAPPVPDDAPVGYFPRQKKQKGALANLFGLLN